MQVSRRTLIKQLVAAGLLPLGLPPAEAGSAGGQLSETIITPRVMVETSRPQGGTTRWTVSEEGGSQAIVDPIVVSPDGSCFVSALVRGDVARNGVWMDVIGASLGSLADASKVRTICRFFSSMAGSGLPGSDPTDLVAPGKNALRWIDSQSVAVLWEDARRVKQVFRVHVPTGEVTQVTFHPTDVVSYECYRDGMLVYAARVEYSDTVSEAMKREGYAVGNVDALSLARGWLDTDGYMARSSDCQWYLKRPGGAATLIDVNGLGRNLHGAWGTLTASFSPDGRFVLLKSTPGSVPSSWDGYDAGDSESGIMQQMIPAAIGEYRVRGSNGFLARQLTQLFLYDVASGRATSVMDAPHPATRVRLSVWSPDSRSFLFGPTYLPVGQGMRQGLAGTALVEVDRQSLKSTIVGIPDGLRIDPFGHQFETLAWISNKTIAVGDSRQKLFYQKDRGKWSRLEQPPSPQTATAASNITVRIEQSREKPPIYVAQDNASSARLVIHDPNPGLGSSIALSHVEETDWRDSRGNPWSGRIYFPLHFEPGRRYPLVIQPYMGAGKDEFSLTGVGGNFPALGPGWSVFVAQSLAARGILVLQTRFMTNYRRENEADAFLDGIERAVRHLDARGIIDSARIGLSGFSRTGWYVMHALIRSDIVFASAVVSDITTGDYMTAMLSPSLIEDHAGAYGAPPFGQGLKNWLEKAPAFNVERILTPLRISNESGGDVGLLSCWEMFARLRELRRPVEYYVIPHLEHGSHTLQNPQQVLAVQNGALDWHDFWLNGGEDRSEEKAQQYFRWRSLRQEHNRVRSDPRAPLLEWSAKPRSSG